jgi:hypothetical protein
MAATTKRKTATERSRGLTSAQKDRISARAFAFPKERKEPLIDAAHVRNAIARFNQVEGVSEEEKQAAWRRIRSAARKYGVEVSAKSHGRGRKAG